LLRTMLAAALCEPLRDHLRQVRELHDADLRRGLGRAPLPNALAPSGPAAEAGSERGS